MCTDQQRRLVGGWQRVLQTCFLLILTARKRKSDEGGLSKVKAFSLPQIRESEMGRLGL